MPATIIGYAGLTGKVKVVMDLQQQIKEVVLSVATDSKANPSPSEALFETGVLDSFGLTDLVAALQKEFGVVIPDSDLRPKNFASIEQIEKYLESRK